MIKTLCFVSVLGFALAAPGVAPAAVPVHSLMVGQADPDPGGLTTPEDQVGVRDVVQSTGAVIDAVKTGKWISIASALIMLLLNLFRIPQLGSLVRKLPSRTRIIIPIVLGGCVGILGNISGGLPWHEALTVGLLTGPTAVFQNELFVNAVLGKRNKRREAETRGSADQG